MSIKSKYLALKISKGFKYIVFATNIVAIVLLLLATRAQTTPPSQWIVVSLLGMGFPILVFINIIYLFFWIIFLQWKYVLVSLIGLACSWPSIATYVPIHTPTEQLPEDCIKFMTYNVRGFGWVTGDSARINPILDYIANSGADIVCMQEFAVEEKKSKNKIISLEEFDDVMVAYPYRTVIRLGNTDDSTIYGLACYSKYPIMRVARVPIESDFNGSAMYEIKIGWKTITIVNNHLESNHITEEDKALYKELVVNRSREKLDEVAQNMIQRLDVAFRAREVQANTIASAIAKQREESNAIVVCGDFNDPPISYAYRTIRGKMADSFGETGRGMGITYHENGFLFRIDYIMHTRNIYSYNSYVDRVKYSDHYPLYSYLYVRYI